MRGVATLEGSVSSWWVHQGSRAKDLAMMKSASSTSSKMLLEGHGSVVRCCDMGLEPHALAGLGAPSMMGGLRRRAHSTSTTSPCGEALMCRPSVGRLGGHGDHVLADLMQPQRQRPAVVVRPSTAT